MNNITAKIVADSISDAGIRITTLELEYPRFIHSQFMTHRQFSRNAQSSRAIPTAKQIELIRDFAPPNFAKNQAGMQAGELLNDWDAGIAEETWSFAKVDAIEYAETLLRLGVHKQWANRLLEPFSTIKVVVTATEWQNFFNLRLHHDAQPEIQELAQAIQTAMDESTPKPLKNNQWHLPYVTQSDFEAVGFNEKVSLISAARCARVSYLNHDNTTPDIEKDLELAKKLLEVEKIREVLIRHLSPFEHQAIPMQHNKCNTLNVKTWQNGITHADRNMYFFSNNFRGWIQHRALV